MINNYSNTELKYNFLNHYKTDYECNKIIEAYEIFATPYHNNFDGFKASKDEEVKLSRKYVRARDTIQELLTEVGSGDKEAILSHIDEAIEWLTLSRGDIKKSYKELAEKTLLSIPFKKTKVAEILKHYRALLKD